LLKAHAYGIQIGANITGVELDIVQVGLTDAKFSYDVLTFEPKWKGGK
jgi:hypothetical protein